MQCPFCEPQVSDVVFAKSVNFLAIYNIAPAFPGHSLIVPRQHITTFLDLSDERLSEMVIFARKVAQLLKGIFYAEGLNLSLQDQEAAGQTLAHVHLHVVPRYKNDIPEPGDWYPKISSNYKEILDSQYRPKLDRNEMDMIVKRLREEAVKMELY